MIKELLRAAGPSAALSLICAVLLAGCGGSLSDPLHLQDTPAKIDAELHQYYAGGNYNQAINLITTLPASQKSSEYTLELAIIYYDSGDFFDAQATAAPLGAPNPAAQDTRLGSLLAYLALEQKRPETIPTAPQCANLHTSDIDQQQYCVAQSYAAACYASATGKKPCTPLDPFLSH